MVLLALPRSSSLYSDRYTRRSGQEAATQSIDPSWRSGIGIGTFGALVSLLVAGIFEYNFGAGQVKLAQWFLVGALQPEKNKSASDGSNENL